MHTRAITIVTIILTFISIAPPSALNFYIIVNFNSSEKVQFYAILTFVSTIYNRFIYRMSQI